MPVTRRMPWRRRVVALVATMQILFCQATPLFALPQNERVASGDVSFARQGDGMTILQTSHKAIVNYDGFDIGSPETVKFIQPDSSAAILNRVTGDQGSVIAGALLANGNVYLINPNGILFTPSSTISVASLFASALDISDRNFSEGRLLFAGGNGSIINRGEISAKDRACLFGNMVENSGTIRAANVFMSAALRSVEIDNAAGGAVRLIVDDQPVSREATIAASREAKPFDKTSRSEDARTTGRTSGPDDSPASRMPSRASRVRSETDAAIAPDTSSVGTVVNQGTVSASGFSGGSVVMSGDRVGQFGVVHADGSSGNGGTVTIIADGTVALSERSLTTANAGAHGNGGTVTVFSPDTSLFRKDARIEAKGGSVAGNGGFIEVSGIRHVEVFGSADASAQNGDAGVFLIDPSNVTIANLPDTGTWTPTGTQFNPSSDFAVANITALLQSLKAGNVTITTMNGAGSQAGNITVADPIDLDGTGTDGHYLHLDAFNNIVVNAGIKDLAPGSSDSASVGLTAGNDITINACIDTGGGNVNIHASGTVVLNSTIATAGGSVSSGGHDFTSAAGATITTGGGSVSLMHTGMVSIDAAINSGAGSVRIDADDLSLQAPLSAGSVQINESHGGGIGLGATPILVGLNIDGDELQRITTSSLELKTIIGSILVDHVTEGQSQNAHSITLTAGGSVTFDTNPSIFDSLIVLANNGIAVNQDLTTLVGNLSLNGDANDAANSNDGIQFANGVQVTSAGGLTLEAFTGDITSAGALGLIANSGVTIKDNLSGPLTGGILTISADNDADGSGVLSIAAGATVNEFDGAIVIDADDLNLQGNLAAASVLIGESHGGGIGLGSTPGGLNIGKAALKRISTADLTLMTSGSIVVDDIAAADSDPVNNVTLIAVGSVGFENHSSTFDSLTVSANNGIVVNQDLATSVGDLSLDGNNSIQFANGTHVTSAHMLTLKAATGDMTGAGRLTLSAKNGISVLNSLTTAGSATLNTDTDKTGGGNLTVAAGATINTAGNALDITANDINLLGNLQGGMIHIHDSDGTGIGLGATPVTGGLNIDGAELQRITTSSLQLTSGGSIKVNGIAGIQSQNADSVTLDAGGTVTFDTNPSTFDSLTVLADNGIAVNRNLTTVVGDLSLDGNSSITFAGGITATSEGSLSLKTATGNMTGAGTLTLNAKDGISVLNSLTTAGAATLNADTDKTGGGDLALAAGATINSAGKTLDITANDINLQGNLQGGLIHIHDSDGTGLGLGATPVIGGLNIDGAELQRITTSALQLTTGGSIKVNGIAGTQSQNADSVTLDASGSVAFDTNPSTFDSLTVLADNGIAVSRNLTTVVGDLSLDGNNSITFASGVTATSESSLSLKAATGNMTGAGALTLNAKNGISVLSRLTTGGATTLNADTDKTGGGDLAVAAGATINTAGNALDITANDINLQGNLQGGTTHIHDSDGTGVGLGATPVIGGLNIDGAELQRITTSALQLTTGGSIKVNGIAGAQSQNADYVTLDAGGSVAFDTNPSTFDSLTVLADNGITVDRDLVTAGGNMSLDGDADNAADGSDSILFAPAVHATSAGVLTLKATTGDIAGTGDLTLSANNGIMILDNLTTAGSLIANGNTTVANGVTLRSGANLSVSDGKWIRGAGALNIYADDHLTLGGDATSAGAMNLAADADGNGNGLLWIKGTVSTDGSIPTGTITLTGEIKVNGGMTVGSPDLSLSGADRNNVDYSIMAPIRAGTIIIRMGHNIVDGTAGEAGLLLAGNVNLTARTGFIGGSGADDIDIAAGTLTAVAGGNIYIEESDSIRIARGVRGGGSVGLNVHESLEGDSISAGNKLTVTAGGDINCTTLAAGDLMDLDGGSLTFNALTARSVDADISGGIAMGRASLADLADFNAGGTISDNDSMITARDIYLLAGGNIGGSAIELNVERISLIKAGGLVHIIQHASGNTPLGLISAGDHFKVEVPNGGFSDGNGAGLNFKARNDSYLALHGTCGGLCSPLQIDINPGHLHVNGINISGADTPDGWVWISLEGILGRDAATSRQIEYTGTVEIPGIVFFNNAAAIGAETDSGDILRTEAFSIETPELKSRQGIFGSPYFLHTCMNISEPIALGAVDYLLHGLAYVYADPELPKQAKRKITMWPKGYSW